MSRPALGAFAAAACWGTSTILARWISRSESTLTQMLSSNALFALGCVPLLPWMWHAPSGMALAVAMLGVGIVGGIGQLPAVRELPLSPRPRPWLPSNIRGSSGPSCMATPSGPIYRVGTPFAGAAMIAAGSLAQVWFENRRAMGEAALAGAMTMYQHGERDVGHRDEDRARDGRRFGHRGSRRGRARSEPVLPSCLTGRRLEQLQRVAADDWCERPTPSLPIMTDPASVATLFATIKSTYGRLDLLFNNAGTNAPADQPRRPHVRSSGKASSTPT